MYVQRDDHVCGRIRCMFDGEGGLDLEALAAATPGLALATHLAGLDLLTLNGHARVVIMQAWERQCSWTAAQMYDAMALVARSPMCVPDSPAELTRHFDDFASVEIGAALKLSPRSADLELSFAYQLTERLPATRAALADGRITLAKARVIADETACLPDALALEAEAFILAQAEDLTRQQLERRLRRKVLQLDPAGAEDRRQDAQHGRRVRVDAGLDGTGSIAGYDLPLVEVAAARGFVQGLAKKLHDDPQLRAGRTLAQLEADVFLDLLKGRQLDASGIQVNVELVAPLETWLRLGAEPAEVAGLGAISAEVMEEIRTAVAASAAWDATAAAAAAASREAGVGTAGDPAGGVRTAVAGAGVGHLPGVACSWTATHDGIVIRHGTGRYRPTQAQRRLIETMHRTCAHPGCTRPATRCDLDHLIEYRLGGPTCTCNLIPLCRRHHRAKHQAGWWWTTPKPDTLQVQSPLGHTYTTRPEPLPGSDPPPPTRPEYGQSRDTGTVTDDMSDPPPGQTGQGSALAEQQQGGTTF